MPSVENTVTIEQLLKFNKSSVEKFPATNSTAELFHNIHNSVLKWIYLWVLIYTIEFSDVFSKNLSLKNKATNSELWI